MVLARGWMWVASVLVAGLLSVVRKVARWCVWCGSALSRGVVFVVSPWVVPVGSV